MKPDTIPANHVKAPDKLSHVCLNWWPSITPIPFSYQMPHRRCMFCANFLPDIEDIGSVLLKTRSCHNVWPVSTNLVKNDTQFANK